MSKLPRSLSIGLWFAGSLFIVGIVYYCFDVAPWVLVGVALMGLVAALIEWRTGGESSQ